MPLQFLFLFLGLLLGAAYRANKQKAQPPAGDEQSLKTASRTLVQGFVKLLTEDRVYIQAVDPEWYEHRNALLRHARRLLAATEQKPKQ